MFIIFLRFADKSRAVELMSAHNSWLQSGFDSGALLLSGSLNPGLGGSLIARFTDREAAETFVAKDPFVAEGVVTAEIAEISPNRADARLEFLIS